jgi:hypothetical protein
MLDSKFLTRRGRPPKSYQNIKELINPSFTTLNIDPWDIGINTRPFLPTSSFGAYYGMSGIGGNVLTGRGGLEDMILLGRTRIPKYGAVTEFGELGRLTSLMPKLILLLTPTTN